jgi:hypothetical protein
MYLSRRRVPFAGVDDAGAMLRTAWTSAIWTCRSRSALRFGGVRLEKLNHTQAIEPRRDALIADEREG